MTILLVMNISRCRLSIIFSMIAFAVSICSASSVSAEIQYVSDQLIITLREGAGNQYKIIRTLKTGTPLEIIEKADQHYRVKTEDGETGWVLRQYISPDIPKSTIISGLNNEIEGLKNEIEKVRQGKEALKDLEKSAQEKNNQIAALTEDLRKKTEQYDRLAQGSQDVANIIEERDRLTEENTRLRDENSELSDENNQLSETKAIYWFVSGGAVFFFGWVAGKLSRKRRRY